VAQPLLNMAREAGRHGHWPPIPSFGSQNRHRRDRWGRGKEAGMQGWAARIAVAAAIVALGSTAAATAQAREERNRRDEREAAATTSYQLSLEAVKKARAATRALIEALERDPGFREFEAAREELDALERKTTLTDAERERLEWLEEREEELEADAGEPGEIPSIEEIEERIERFPSTAHAIERAGMSPREYARFFTSMMEASMYAGLRKAGLTKALPSNVHAANVAFVEAHEAEITAWQADLARFARTRR
jgi:hypothetical protein